MFAVNYPSNYTVNYPVVSFFDLLQQQYEEQQRQQQQQQLRQPKITKKIETEDDYQIHITKEVGDFKSFEVRAVKGGKGLVRLIIESEPDNFQASVLFALSEIDLEKINWHYFRAENTLVLQVPKQRKVCYPQFYFPGCVVASEDHSEKLKEKQARREQARQAQIEKEKAEAIKAKERARKEAERAKKAAEEHARREAEKARKEAERQARLEAARIDRAKKEAEEQARRELRAREHAKLQERKERVRREAEERNRAQQEKFVEQLVQNFFPSLVSQIAQQTNQTPEKNAGQEDTRQEDTTHHEDTPMDDNESVQSEPLSPEAGSPKLSPADKSLDLHKHPSMEEVEDEEFVMFRKKFDQ